MKIFFEKLLSLFYHNLNTGDKLFLDYISFEKDEESKLTDENLK